MPFPFEEGRAAAAKFHRRQGFGQDVADLGVRLAPARVLNGELAAVVLDGLDHVHQPGEADFTGLGVDLGTNVRFRAVTLPGAAGIGVLERAEHDLAIDQLLAGDRIGDLQQFKPVGGNGHGHSSVGVARKRPGPRRGPDRFPFGLGRKGFLRAGSPRG